MRNAIVSLGAAIGLALSVSGPAPASETPEPGAVYSYILGFQVADRVLHKLAQDGVAPSHGDLRAGMQDRLDGKEPRFTQEQVLGAIQTLQSEQASRTEALAAANRARGEAYLAENAKADGVKVLPSGLQYIESEPGTGEQPKEDSTVVVHYRGTLVNGEEFDSSFARGEPAKFMANAVIPGFREALLGMREGAKWRVFIPSDLAYGEQGAGDRIGPNETLVFELELIEVVTE